MALHFRDVGLCLVALVADTRTRAASRGHRRVGPGVDFRKDSMTPRSRSLLAMAVFYNVLTMWFTSPSWLTLADAYVNPLLPRMHCTDECLSTWL
jgi:hypothetical protein